MAMIEQQQRILAPKETQPLPGLPPPSGNTDQTLHLLKVAGSVARDASLTWAGLWAQLKHCSTSGGSILPNAAEGFVPPSGWPEFLEKFWELKHYIDSIQRICAANH